MIFNSLTFLVFLAIVVSLYWVLSFRLRMWMVLIASCVFYGFWRWEYLSVMFVSAFTDYLVAIQIEKTPIEQKRKRKQLLAVTLIVNLGLLLYFKYLYFFTDNLNALSDLLGTNVSLPLEEILLPFGISFYTFETISYTMDVYRGHIKAEKSFLHYGLFVTFFPKLVAGPIQRASELLVQLKVRPAFHQSFIAEGLRRILYGLFLKVFLADNISPLVDDSFNANPELLSALDVWMMSFLFGFQIYFDFSAYSHIAVGSSKLMGITIPENFNFPYLASSFKDFWKRWHISLSSWIRDYLYLPLAGVKVVQTTGKGGIGESIEKTNSRESKNSALFATWFIMGLWHGANWTFAVWGLYHATMIYFERILRPVREKFSILQFKPFNWFITLLLSMLAWIPFRAENLSDTLIMYQKIITPSAYLFISLKENNYLITCLILVLILLSFYATFYVEPRLKPYKSLNFILNVVKYTVIIIFVFTFLRPISQFIYFQF